MKTFDHLMSPMMRMREEDWWWVWWLCVTIERRGICTWICVYRFLIALILGESGLVPSLALIAGQCEHLLDDLWQLEGHLFPASDTFDYHLCLIPRLDPRIDSGKPLNGQLVKRAQRGQRLRQDVREIVRLLLRFGIVRAMITQWAENFLLEALYFGWFNEARAI